MEKPQLLVMEQERARPQGKFLFFPISLKNTRIIYALFFPLRYGSSLGDKRTNNEEIKLIFQNVILFQR